MLTGIVDAPLAQLGAAGFAALGVYIAGIRSGKAQFITAVHAAAKEVIDSLQAENKRLTDRLDASEAREAKCQENLAATRRELGLQALPA